MTSEIDVHYGGRKVGALRGILPHPPNSDFFPAEIAVQLAPQTCSDMNSLSTIEYLPVAQRRASVTLDKGLSLGISGFNDSSPMRLKLARDSDPDIPEYASSFESYSKGYDNYVINFTWNVVEMTLAQFEKIFDLDCFIPA